jgi:hypothetical protein
MAVLVVRELMFWSATEEPRLISERRQETAQERQIAGMGTCHIGDTYCVISILFYQRSDLEAVIAHTLANVW